MNEETIDETLSKCNKCSYCILGSLTSLNELVCSKELPQFSTKKDVECDQFKSMYIEFPLVIEDIDNEEETLALFKYDCGQLVKVAPCAEEYEGKTYLGILLGNMRIGSYVTFNPETKILTVSPDYNPAIFVPALKKVIWGCECWWGKIKSEKDFKDITNEEIDNLWYVKLLKEFGQK